MNNKHVFKIVFLIIILFVFLPELSANSTKSCYYKHPDYPQCTLRLNKGDNGWGYAAPSLRDMTYTPCINEGGVGAGKDDVWDISPNTYHYRGEKNNDKRFFKLFGDKYDEQGGCPDLYIGTKKYKCNSRNSMADPAAADYYCFFAYFENNKNGTRKKAVGEKKDAETLEDLNDQYMDEKQEQEEDKKKHKYAKIKNLTSIEINNKFYSCEQLIGEDTKEILEYIFLVIRVATPIILIVLTMLDFSKAIAADENELQNAITRFVKRTIAAILIFLAPTLIEFLMDITGISDGTCGLDL